MKLLTNEAEFIVWAETTVDLFGERPNQYPCYVYATGSAWGDGTTVPGILYLADCEIMVSELLKHTPKTENE